MSYNNTEVNAYNTLELLGFEITDLQCKLYTTFDLSNLTLIDTLQQ